jgi:hypothetical protein
MGRPRYGPAQVRAQMKAGYDNGVRSWILWNPGSRYTLGALGPEGASERDDAPRAAARRDNDRRDTAARPR